MFEFLKKKKRLTKEEKFWKYFDQNKKSLEEFINSDLSDYTAYNKLTDEIHKYSDLIFPEVTQNSDDKFVLIITPDGNQAEFLIPKNFSTRNLKLKTGLSKNLDNQKTI